jgi:hypothetical protein
MYDSYHNSRTLHRLWKNMSLQNDTSVVSFTNEDINLSNTRKRLRQTDDVDSHHSHHQFAEVHEETEASCQEESKKQQSLHKHHNARSLRKTLVFMYSEPLVPPLHTLQYLWEESGEVYGEFMKLAREIVDRKQLLHDAVAAKAAQETMLSLEKEKTAQRQEETKQQQLAVESMKLELEKMKLQLQLQTTLTSAAGNTNEQRRIVAIDDEMEKAGAHRGKMEAKIENKIKKQIAKAEATVEKYIDQKMIEAISKGIKDLASEAQMAAEKADKKAEAIFVMIETEAKTSVNKQIEQKMEEATSKATMTIEETHTNMGAKIATYVNQQMDKRMKEAEDKANKRAETLYEMTLTEMTARSVSNINLPKYTFKCDTTYNYYSATAAASDAAVAAEVARKSLVEIEKAEEAQKVKAKHAKAEVARQAREEKEKAKAAEALIEKRIQDAVEKAQAEQRRANASDIAQSEEWRTKTATVIKVEQKCSQAGENVANISPLVATQNVNSIPGVDPESETDTASDSEDSEDSDAQSIHSFRSDY